MTRSTPARFDPILDAFGLTGDQRMAAVARQRDVTVTAGAGSGKTRTLVARYLGLLIEGSAPRQVVAITFTEKAAREMRTRVRTELRGLVLAAQDPAERQQWAELEAQLDSAWIGTIHSLCAEILRAHPAEAGLDPQFGVVDESLTIQLRSAAVEAALVSAVEQPAELLTQGPSSAGQPGARRALFNAFSINRLQALLTLLLARRLDIAPDALNLAQGEQLVLERLQQFLRREDVQTILRAFRQHQAEDTLQLDAGEKLAEQLVRLLALFQEAEQALSGGIAPGSAAAACGAALWRARREAMGLAAGKKTSQAKEALRELRDIYDTLLDPWLGGKSATSTAPDVQIEAHLASLMPLLQKLYQQALAGYRAALAERQALDFDDLEAGALALLQIPAVAARWQAEITAVLVDEFQDTNARQRQIVLMLCGAAPGRLFVVGDARQSIYRFRGADVTVFTDLQQAVQARGGLRIDLDRTFRAHPGLLEAIGSLLADVMGEQADPERPFYVPFTPLISQRSAPNDGVQPPYIECVLGVGADRVSGRQAAAQALAVRLKELRAAGEIPGWDEVALLFRASTGFPFYEEAFEAAGIPFVTVAGSGFYDRPEVRDVLNLLRALADPWDDQALAGFLRSPAIGLSDPALYRLRYQNGAYRSLRQALAVDQARLPAADRPLAERALKILEDFAPWVDRLPVAELLRRLIARTDYRAILAASRSRLWRNVDKLLADAQSSGLVRVRAFLDNVDTLRDVGAREGEAAADPAVADPARPEAEGAVRLMTIHKSKGLEFPVVVLADAARQMLGSHDLAYPLGPGWTVTADRVSASPLTYRLARHIDAQQADAENGRLLYVALTRAMEKLILSGHVSVKEDGSWKCSGWLQSLLEAGGADVAACLAAPGTAHTYPLAAGGSWRLWLPLPTETAPAAPARSTIAWPETNAAPLVEPLVMAIGADSAPLQRPLGVVFSPALPQVVGGLVHAALRRWLFADAGPALDGLLRVHARQAGLLGEDEIAEALRITKTLLARFRRHPLWAAIQSAEARHHGLPCHTGLKGEMGAAYIDLLYRSGTDWTMVDFHTGSLQGSAAQQAAVALRLPELQAKRQAVTLRINGIPKALVCFLDVDHRIRIQTL